METPARQGASYSLLRQSDLHGDDEGHERASSGMTAMLRSSFLLRVVGMAVIGGFLFGYDQGVVSNVLVLESFGAHYPSIFMNASVKGWFVSSLLASAWVGSLVNGPLCDLKWLGRRRNIIANVVVFLVGSSIQASASSTFGIFLGRIIAGVSVGALTHCIPIYISELSPSGIRGSLVALQQLAITLGILVAYWLAFATRRIGGIRCAPDVPYSGPLRNGFRTFDPYHDVPYGGCTAQRDASWRIPLAFQLLPAVFLGMGMIFMPSSPRWLLQCGRNEEALSTLFQLRAGFSEKEIHSEYVEIVSEIRFSRHKHSIGKYAGASGVEKFFLPYRELFATYPMFKRTAMGNLTMFLQQFIGANAIIYYAPKIFSQLGLDANTSSLMATGVYGIINVLATLPTVFLVDVVGRRPLLMCGALGCAFALTAVGTVIALYEGEWKDHKTAGYIGIFFIYFYDANFAYSFAPLGWVIPSEIYPLALRSTGISLSTSCTWASNFAVGLMAPVMLENIPHGGTYFFFGAFAVLGFLLTWLWFPETARLSLTQMDEAFHDHASTGDKELLEELAASVEIPVIA